MHLSIQSLLNSCNTGTQSPYECMRIQRKETETARRGESLKKKSNGQKCLSQIKWQRVSHRCEPQVKWQRTQGLMVKYLSMTCQAKSAVGSSHCQPQNSHRCFHPECGALKPNMQLKQVRKPRNERKRSSGSGFSI